MTTDIFPSAASADRLVDGVPIPDDARIVPPSAAVPEGQRRFLGAWVGRWGGALAHILIVESVQPDGSASVIYGWGDNPRVSVTRGYARLGASLSGDTLTIASSFEVPGGDGHRVIHSSPLWTAHVDRYLDSIGERAKP